MSTARKVFSVLGALLLLELVAQFFLIATAALHVWGAQTTDTATSGQIWAGFQSGDPWANAHATNGSFFIPITILLMIVFSFVARLPRDRKIQTASLFGLMIIQVALAFLGFAGNSVASVLAGLHGVNALAILGLSGVLVRGTWAFGESARTPASAAAPAPEAGR